MVKHLPGKQEALSANPRATKKKEKCLKGGPYSQ
jgi:hypothetical protein